MACFILLLTSGFSSILSDFSNTSDEKIRKYKEKHRQRFVKEFFQNQVKIYQGKYTQ
jgi:hypothetical protein